MIKVYDSNEKLFNHNGIKILNPIKCCIFKKDNGDYYVELEDTVENIDYYQANMIITCPTPFPEGVQAFRLSNPIKKNSKISVIARHVYFDSKNYIIEDNNIVDKNCNYAINHLNDNTDIESPFTVSSNITINNSYRCIRKSLEEATNVIINRWGGHLIRDNYNFAINETIGQDRGIVLKYGKNITNIKSEENWDSVTTKIMPVGKDGQLLPERYLELDEQLYDIPFTNVILFEQNIDEEDYNTYEQYEAALIEDLRNQAVSFLNENKYPKVNYSLSAHLDNITDVGDTILVDHEKLKIKITTNVISVKWDAISKKYKNIEFGNFKNSLKDLIKNINKQTMTIVENISNETKGILQKELSEATSKILGMTGNSHFVPGADKILVVDSLPIESAQHAMIMNSGGIGFSQNGIHGPFNSAWAIDGTLDMQNINVVNLVADLIKGGTLRLGNINNSNGTLEVYDNDGNIIGKIDSTGIQFDNLNDALNENNQKINELSLNIDGINLKAEENLYIYDSDGNKDTISNVINQLKVNTNEIEASLQKVGGLNLMRNSSGQNGTVGYKSKIIKPYVEFQTTLEFLSAINHTGAVWDEYPINENDIISYFVHIINGQPTYTKNDIWLGLYYTNGFTRHFYYKRVIYDGEVNFAHGGRG